MKNSLKDLAMLDVAEALLKEHGKPMSINELIANVCKIKNIDAGDYNKLTQFYMDITQSAKFVYSGNDEWDLKERNLELWDKDGYAFVTPDEVEEVEEEEEDLEFTEFVFEEKEEEPEVEEDEDEETEEEETLDEAAKKKKAEEEKERKEEEAYIEVELDTKSTDDDDGVDIEFDDIDEDDYNEIMDNYEDMYDED